MQLVVKLYSQVMILQTIHLFLEVKESKYLKPDHLLLGTDYSIGGVDGNKHTEITLNCESASDVITIYAYTGSYQEVQLVLVEQTDSLLNH